MPTGDSQATLWPEPPPRDTVGRMSTKSDRVRKRAEQDLTGHAEEARSATFRYACVESAEQALGTLRQSWRVALMTKGQFSLLDLLRAITAQIGPADVTISTWTAGLRDVEHCKWLIETQAIRSLRMIVDKQFPVMQPGYARRVTELFGAEALRITKNHAKFAVLRNEEWAVSVRTSMNLNRNPRWEWAEVETAPAMADFLDRMVSEIWELGTPGAVEIPADVGEVFDAALQDKSCGDVLLSELSQLERWARLGYTRKEIRERQERASDDYLRGLDNLEDALREVTVSAAQSGDAAARKQVQAWLERARKS